MERLLGLLTVLIDTPRPLTAAEIQARVPGYPADLSAFRGAFERDKVAVRTMIGVPLSPQEVPGTDPPALGYRLHPRDAHLADPGLEPEERAALHLAASAVRIGGIEATGGLWKLGGAPPYGGSVPVDPRGRGTQRTGAGGDGPVADVGELPADRNLVRLFAAITDQRDVAFGYRGEQRRVAPHRLDYVRGRWYVTGHDHGRDDLRNFRLDRIDGDVTTGDRSEHRRPSEAGPGVRLAPWELGGEPPVTARLLVDADQRPNALATARGAHVAEERDDGSVVLELRVTSRAGFRSYVLGFLDHAEVLGPAELREDLVAWLAATIDRVEGRR